MGLGKEGYKDLLPQRILDKLSIVEVPQEHQLTNRELAVIFLASQGLYGKEIAAMLGISIETVRGHLKNISAKLGTKNQAHAVATALRMQIIF